jgi:hypothetical protein
MKKIFISFFALTLLLTSCSEELLDTYNPGVLSEEESVKSVVDLQRFMNRTYNLLTPTGEIAFNSVFTDEVAIGFANGGQGLGEDYVFNINSDATSPNSIWSSNYVTIAYASRVIKEADKLLVLTPLDANEINKLKAEALSIRAYCHNQLISYFSTNPKSGSELGVVVATEVYPYTYTALRKTNAEVYTQIDADLSDAIALFASIGGAADRLRGNVDFARAVQARSYALRGDYPKALVFANQVIASSGLVLAPATTYRAMFHTDNQPVSQEIIFKIKKTQGQTRTGGIWASINATYSGSPFFEMSRSLFNKIKDVATTDIRYSTLVSPTSVIDESAYLSNPLYNVNSEVLVIRKYPGVTAASNRVLVNDIKIMRLSEMYFIRAEALAAAGDYINSEIAVRAVKQARRISGTVPVLTYAGAQDAYADILNERRIEFAYEGYRFVDLKRLGALAGVTINRDSKDCSFYGACSLSITDYRFTLPIPTSETNANSAILAQQNPGY